MGVDPLMYSNTNSRGGMALILSITLTKQCDLLDAPLIARINHIALIFAEVRAILNADSDRHIDIEDHKTLKIISENIDSIRDSYEPIMDDPESRQAADSKRKTTEKLLDLTRYYLLFEVEKYKLCDISALKDIAGVPWELSK
jgi:hypothetical protein